MICIHKRDNAEEVGEIMISTFEGIILIWLILISTTLQWFALLACNGCRTSMITVCVFVFCQPWFLLEETALENEQKTLEASIVR